MGAGHNSGGPSRKRAKFFGLIAAASAGLAFAMSPFGCGLDDTAVPELGGAFDGSIVDTGIVVDDSGKPIVDGGEPDVVVCTPETCASYPSVCRAGLSNNCGGTIDCTNACPTGQACIADSGTCDGPPVCRDAGAPGGNCGTIVNPGNTTLTANCGTCSNGYSCTTNTCGCTSAVVCGGACCPASTNVCNGTTCCAPEALATTCGNSCGVTKTNNCGQTVTCPSTCTTGMCAPNTHTCDAPPTCTNMGQNGGNCGTLTGSDGLTASCGTCSVTNETCTNNLCGCPNTTCNSACCTTGQVCFGGLPTGACCSKTCSAYACAESDSCGGNCGNSCPLPDYSSCYAAGNICTCDSSAGSCSACPSGYTQCSAGPAGKYKSCVPNGTPCP